MRDLARSIEGYSGADIAALYSETAMSAIRKQMEIEENGRASMKKAEDEIVISKEDFEIAKDVIKTTRQRAVETEEQIRLMRES